MLSSKKSQNESLDLAVGITEKPEEIPGGSIESERLEAKYLSYKRIYFSLQRGCTADGGDSPPLRHGAKVA
jgi:hypothetical protein